MTIMISMPAQAVAKGGSSNPPGPASGKRDGFRALLKGRTKSEESGKHPHAKSSARRSPASPLTDSKLASQPSASGLATVEVPHALAVKGMAPPRGPAESSRSVGIASRGRYRRIQPSGGGLDENAADLASTGAISLQDALKMGTMPTKGPRVVKGVTVGPHDTGTNAGSTRTAAAAPTRHNLVVGSTRILVRTEVAGISDIGTAPRSQSLTSVEDLKSVTHGASLVEGNGASVGPRPTRSSVSGQVTVSRTSSKAFVVSREARVKSPWGQVTVKRASNKASMASPRVKAKSAPAGTTGANELQSAPPTTSVVRPANLAESTGGRAASSAAVNSAKSGTPSGQRALPTGWKIEPTQVDNRDGVRQSTWSIKPPLSSGTPLKMELTQQGATLKANLTVSPSGLGYLDLVPTVLPHQAVHLPQGVATLQFTVTTPGGGGAGGQGNPEPRQAAPQAPGNSPNAQPQVAVTATASSGLTVLDYRA